MSSLTYSGLVSSEEEYSMVSSGTHTSTTKKEPISGDDWDISTDAKGVSKCDLPDQTHADLLHYGYVAQFIEFGIVVGMIIIADREIEETKVVYAIAISMALVAGAMFLFSARARDRGFLLAGSILQIGVACIAIPNFLSLMVAYREEQSTCFTTDCSSHLQVWGILLNMLLLATSVSLAWLQWRAMEKLQEEMFDGTPQEPSDSDEGHHTFDLPDFDSEALQRTLVGLAVWESALCIAFIVLGALARSEDTMAHLVLYALSLAVAISGIAYAVMFQNRYVFFLSAVFQIWNMCKPLTFVYQVATSARSAKAACFNGGNDDCHFDERFFTTAAVFYAIAVPTSFLGAWLSLQTSERMQNEELQRNNGNLQMAREPLTYLLSGCKRTLTLADSARALFILALANLVFGIIFFVFAVIAEDDADVANYGTFCVALLLAGTAATFAALQNDVGFALLAFFTALISVSTSFQLAYLDWSESYRTSSACFVGGGACADKNKFSLVMPFLVLAMLVELILAYLVLYYVDYLQQSRAPHRKALADQTLLIRSGLGKIKVSVLSTTAQDDNEWMSSSDEGDVIFVTAAHNGHIVLHTDTGLEWTRKNSFTVDLRDRDVPSLITFYVYEQERIRDECLASIDVDLVSFCKPKGAKTVKDVVLGHRRTGKPDPKFGTLRISAVAISGGESEDESEHESEDVSVTFAPTEEDSEMMASLPESSSPVPDSSSA